MVILSYTAFLAAAALASWFAYRHPVSIWRGL